MNFLNKTGSGALVMVVVGASLITLACNDLNASKTASIIERNPVKLDAEQVMLTQVQVDCGIQAELWLPATDPNQGRSVCPLLPKGKALKFDDDVVVLENGYHSPYVQIRGAFPVAVADITNTTNGPEKDTMLVEAKVGVRIGHPCFQNPLPVMGLRKGQFTQDYSPVILLRLDDGWQLDKFVH
jgi:hypothetical protein